MKFKLSDKDAERVWRRIEECLVYEDRIKKLEEALWQMNEEIAELRCGRSAFIEVLEMAVPQTGKRTKILKTEGGEESEAFLIPREEVESVLQRYRP